MYALIRLIYPASYLPHGVQQDNNNNDIKPLTSTWSTPHNNHTSSSYNGHYNGNRGASYLNPDNIWY